MIRRDSALVRHAHARRWRRALIGASALLASLTVAAPALAATPTAPPPVTILTSSGHVGRGDIFITPTGDTSAYANGPEILDRHGNVVWFHPIPQGQTAADFRTQTYRGQPVLTWWQGTGLGGLSLRAPTTSTTTTTSRSRPSTPATVCSADGHEFLITPVEHRADPGLHHRDREPDLDRRPRRPDRDQRRRPGDRHPHRQGAVPVEQRGPRPLQPERAAAAGLAEHTVGLVPHQRGAPRHRRQPADRRPRHVDDLQGQPLHRTDHLAARRQGQQLHAPAAPGQTLDNAGEIFAWQHDPEAIGHDVYTFFDNESAGTPSCPQPSGDGEARHATRVATLVASDDQPEGLVAASQGNAQTTPRGGLFVGWGALPYFSEFDRRGGSSSTPSSRPG